MPQGWARCKHEMLGPYRLLAPVRSVVSRMARKASFVRVMEQARGHARRCAAERLCLPCTGARRQSPTCRRCRCCGRRALAATRMPIGWRWWQKSLLRWRHYWATSPFYLVTGGVCWSRTARACSLAVQAGEARNAGVGPCRVGQLAALPAAPCSPCAVDASAYGVLDQLAAAAMNPRLAQLVAAHPNLVSSGAICGPPTTGHAPAGPGGRAQATRHVQGI